MAIAGSLRTMERRLLLSWPSEESRRRLKMIVSGTSMCSHPAAIDSMENCQSWNDSPLGMSRET
jgi:hypothetical protein